MITKIDRNSSQIHDLLVDLNDVAMAATTGGLNIPLTGFQETVIKVAFLNRWEARFNAGNPNLPLVAQRLITAYYKGTNKPEYVASFKSGNSAIGWKSFAPQIFNFLPFTAGGTSDAISSAASLLSLF